MQRNEPHHTHESGGKHRFVHDALFYDSDEGMLTTAVPFLAEGLAADDSVMLVCRSRLNHLLLDALDNDSRIVCGPQPGSLGQPTQVIAGYIDTIRDMVDPATRLRVVGEVQFGTTRAEWIVWERYEAVINRALAPCPLWGVCMYHTEELPDEILRAGELTHPTILTRDSHTPNPHYTDPSEFVRQLPHADPDPLEQSTPTFEVPELHDVAGMRSEGGRLARAGSALPLRKVENFVLAVTEVATNALQHGRRPVRVRLWAAPGQLVCTVTDRGEGFNDPLAGYAPAPAGDDRTAGKGLWLARLLCDQLDTARDPDGFTVRLRTEE
ncbi:sensor histidine kinase [Actinopolymorpha sp. NPDC004070]|uniref:sensor histidine kinase n=1 Tax=Actinopolymorpha sp. NPDC004070 TaxID=3154548 RepID=UPI0033AF302E